MKTQGDGFGTYAKPNRGEIEEEGDWLLERFRRRRLGAGAGGHKR